MKIGTEAMFTNMLGLSAQWEVYDSHYEEERGIFILKIRETKELCKSQRCSKDKCRKATFYDHIEPRYWRHLNVFNKECIIECELPRFKCLDCGYIYRVKAPREGLSKGLSKEFEAFALTLLKEMPVKRAGEILGENDKRLWRLLEAHVDKARQELDLSCVTRVGVDEMSYRKGHKYISVFADLKQKSVIFGVPGKDKTTWDAFSDELYRRNGHPHGILFAAMDMSVSYQSGARNNCRNAQIVFDKFHMMKIVNERLDAVRKAEFYRGTPDAKKQLKGTMWLWRKNPCNLNEKQQAHFGRIDREYLWTAKAYQMRLALQDIYNNIPYRSWAERRLKSWCNWVTEVASKAPHLLMEPMTKVVETIQSHWDGILGYWSSGKMTTAFMEGLNSVFSAVKRKARGYKNPHNLINMLYFVAGKLNLNFGKYH